MRVNVYTEELSNEVAIVRAEYINNKGETDFNWGLRFILKSHDGLHRPPKDDDRSAVTFWCGNQWDNMERFLLNALDAYRDGTWTGK